MKLIKIIEDAGYDWAIESYSCSKPKSYGAVVESSPANYVRDGLLGPVLN